MSFRNYYDTSTYGRSRGETGRTNASHNASERPTTVTAKYITPTSSYKSSSIPILNRDRSSTREAETPISTIKNRYANYNKTAKDERPTTKYGEKKDTYKLTVPTVTTNRSRDVSPVSTSSKYSLSRTTRHLSPDKRGVKGTSLLTKGRSRDPSPTDRDKDIPSKTDKSPGYSSLSSYKLYPRTTNYTRPSARTESKPDITVNRYAIANRLSSNYLRSPISEKPRTSVSPILNIDTSRVDIEKSRPSITVTITNDTVKENKNITVDVVECNLTNGDPADSDDDTQTVTMITRHTSPTPPGSSAYVRTRRADMAKTIENTITRSKKRPQMEDKGLQSDRMDDPTRCSRFGSAARATISNWSIYTPNINSYTGYAGRYSTQYGNIRENNTSPYSDKNSVRSDESQTKDIVSTNSESQIDNNANNDAIYVIDNNNKANPCEIKEDSPEIVINVNLKLKKANSSTTTDLVSPEITITNNQLPPQAPKTDGVTKTKKTKVRKSSTDSSSDSSKKKIVKRRSKSISSNDSDQCSEKNLDEKSKESISNSASKGVQKISSTGNLVNITSKFKHSKKNQSSRESDSPESSVTLSTQSSISEDENISKSKTNDVSRTSADEASISMDRSAKQSSPQKSEPGAEEAKSFLIRALAPVTNLFKKQPDSTDHSKWLENSTSESTGKDISNILTESDRSNKSKNNTDNIIASNDNNVVKLKCIRHVESGERAWWLNSESEKDENSRKIGKKRSPSEINIVKNLKHIESGERVWWLESNGDNKSEKQTNDSADSNKPSKNCKFVTLDSDEKPWWLDSSANIPEGIERLTPPRKSSSDSDKSEKYDFYKVRRMESGEKDWWLSSESTSTNMKEGHTTSVSKSGSDQRSFPLRRIRHVESGERPWWLSSSKNIPEGIEKLPTPPPQEESDSSDSEELQVYVPPTQQVPRFPLNLPDDEPLGARRSPEGLETPRETEVYTGRISPYENARQYRRTSHVGYSQPTEKYISRYTDIDDILGTSGQIYSPFMDSILARRTGQMQFDDSECEEIDPTQVRIHDSTAQRPVIKKLRCRSEIVDYCDEDQLDDAALQVFKDGDYGSYLDLDSTLSEQDEDLEGLQDNRKNAIVLRTQLSVRVHAIIERLQQSQGRELRRALFTLKQILQSDKDLVHEFVANKGLDCLMQVGNMADHNYLDYILRALGQILLYVDGMHGVMEHKRCVQWLYSLIASKFRHVVKTALKLLLVFVEYTEKNCLLLIDAIQTVDNSNGRQAWYNIMHILQNFEASDTELLIYATTLINRCLNNVPDRDTYYDQVDALQEQGIDETIQNYMSKPGTDLDLLRQLQIFEAVLLYEDGEDNVTSFKQLDESIMNSVHRRSMNLKTSERRKSKKFLLKDKENGNAITDSDVKTKTNGNRTQYVKTTKDEYATKDLNTALKRRRDRFARQTHHIIQQQELFNKSNSLYSDIFLKHNGNSGSNNSNTNGDDHTKNNYVDSNLNYAKDPEEEKVSNFARNLKTVPDVLINGNQKYTPALKQRLHNGTLVHNITAIDAMAVMRQKQMDNGNEMKSDRSILLNKEHSIKDLANKLTTPVSPTSEDKPSRLGDMAGIVSKAKEELAKSQSKEIVKSPTIEIAPKIHEIKLSENDMHWEELKKGCINREFHLCDLDFSDLRQDAEDDFASPLLNYAGIPPPPPPASFPLVGAPPPPPNMFALPKNNIPAPPSKPVISSEQSNDSDSSTIKKNKKTVKLFWKEVQENSVPTPLRTKVNGLFWDDLPNIELDTKILEHLFESRTNDLIIKKTVEAKRHVFLDAKRSNAINIAMKKLPTPQCIKNAILKMDATAIGREGIEKLFSLLPTEEEKGKINEVQSSNPGLPLGSAEQFLMTLGSISEVSSRLRLWVFKLDFDNLEKEIAEPLMDLKQGIELLKINKTFKIILSTLRSVGSFLNGSQVKGFRLEYLSKVVEVKDTVHKHPLLHHICDMIVEKFPDSSDLFSEVGPVIRASKVDFDMLHTNLSKLESDCKASWDHLKKIAKHDGSQIFKTKITDFLTDAAERTILLGIIKKRVMARYNKFLLFLGVPATDLDKSKPSEFLKNIAEFALEYRTARERTLNQLEKKANHRERNKTRGKMIIEVGNYSTKNTENTADNALTELLKTNSDTNGTGEGRKKSKPARRMLINDDESADEEIIESLVRSSTNAISSKRRAVPRERRNRISDRKNLNRTLDGNQSWPGRENSPGSGLNHHR